MLIRGSTNSASRRPRRAAIAAVVIGLSACFGWIVFRSLSQARPGDFGQFYHAAQAVRSGGDLYAGGGYVYPPLLAVLLSPLSVFEWRTASRLWFVVNASLMALALVIGTRDAARRFDLPRDLTTRAGLALAALLLTFDQARFAFENGQTDVLMLTAFMLSLAWLDRRPLAAGAALGFAANIKYLTLAVVPYLIIRGRFRAAASTLVSAVIFALAPALILGWGRNLESLGQALGGLGSLVGFSPAAGAAGVQGLTYDRSVSIASLAGRLAERWGGGMAAVAAIVLGAALVCVGIAAAIYARSRTPLFRGRWGAAEASPGRESIVAVEWSGLIVLTLVFSPQTEVRHTLLLLLPHLYSAALFLACNGPRQRTLLAAGVLVGQLGVRLPPGGPTFREALAHWRWIAGASWCILAQYTAFLWAALACNAAANASRLDARSAVSVQPPRDGR